MHRFISSELFFVIWKCLSTKTPKIMCLGWGRWYLTPRDINCRYTIVRKGFTLKTSLCDAVVNSPKSLSSQNIKAEANCWKGLNFINVSLVKKSGGLLFKLSACCNYLSRIGSKNMGRCKLFVAFNGLGLLDLRQ